jgi:hypothetical protein
MVKLLLLIVFLFASSMSDKADWSDSFVRNLFDAANTPMRIFTSTGWKNLISKFADKSGDKRTKKQLKNKLDIFKKEYSLFMEFKNYATGLGWDAEKRTVDCSEEWWEEHLAVRTKLSL